MRLLSEPRLSTVVAFTSDDPALDLFVLADELTVRGWHTQPQLAHGPVPRSIHLTITASVRPRASEFGKAFAEAAAAARAAGPVILPAELVGLVGGVDPADLTDDLVASLAGALGIGGADQGPLPERQAMINTLLEAAPPPVRAAMFTAFLSLLQRPSYE